MLLIQILVASVAGAASIGWLIYYFVQRQNITSQVSVILDDEAENQVQRIFPIERIILQKMKLSDKFVWWVRLFFLAVIVTVVYILGPVIGITYIALISIILFFSRDPLNDMKTEVENLSYAVYIIKSTYGQGLAIDDTIKALRESSNPEVIRWVTDYAKGDGSHVPHRFVTVLDKLYFFQSGGKNASAYIEAMREQVENKTEMINQAILAIREVLFIKISYYIAVPLFMLMSYAQAPDVWGGWVGGILAIVIMLFFLTYNVLLKRISITTRDLVDF